MHVLGCYAARCLTAARACGLFVTPDDIIQQAPVRLDQFNILNLSCCLFPVPPTLSASKMPLCIFNLLVEQEVEGMFQRNLETQNDNTS